jgi:hypothetical protein
MISTAMPGKDDVDVVVTMSFDLVANPSNSCRTSVGKILLNGGSLDVEVVNNNKNTGIFITIQCQKL